MDTIKTSEEINHDRRRFRGLWALGHRRAKAVRLAASNPNGRRPLIYGVTADGRSGLVTDALSPP